MTDSPRQATRGAQHGQVIRMWPDLSIFAADIGVSYGAAKQMRRRNSIAASHWRRVVSAAQRRGLLGVTFETLASARGTVPRRRARPCTSNRVSV